MQKFINNQIITIDGSKYLKEEDNLRKIITTNEEKFNLIWKAHAIVNMKVSIKLMNDYENLSTGRE